MSIKETATVLLCPCANELYIGEENSQNISLFTVKTYTKGDSNFRQRKYEINVRQKPEIRVGRNNIDKFFCFFPMTSPFVHSDVPK